MENNQSQKEVFLKMNFFKKVWYSITKFEKYPELAALGFKKAIIYFTQIVIIFSIIYTGTFVYYVSNVAQFDEENLGLSEKIVKIMTRDADTENEQVNQAISIMNEYSDKTIIGALFISIFISFFIATLMDVFTLSIFGMLTCIIAKISRGRLFSHQRTETRIFGRYLRHLQRPRWVFCLREKPRGV